MSISTEQLLVTGLGNPGGSYAGHRHNIGFMAVDEIADAHGFAPWRQQFGGLVSEGRVDGRKILLLKPLGFMNRSGQSVGEAVRYFRLEPPQLIVIHDELDLAPGKLKMKDGGGTAGHNGLRSIAQHIGPHFRRMRLGIGHPGDKALVSPYVLSDFAKADQSWLQPLLKAIARQFVWLTKDDDARFMTEVARELQDNR